MSPNEISLLYLLCNLICHILTYYQGFQSQCGIFVVKLMDLLQLQYIVDHERYLQAHRAVHHYLMTDLQVRLLGLVYYLRLRYLSWQELCFLPLLRKATS